MIYPSLHINHKIWNRLFRSWKTGKLPHALLFHGPLGSGKEGHALELAALVNCNSAINERACGKCPSCKKTHSFKHEHVKLILPLPRGKISTKDDPIMKAFTGKSLNDESGSIKTKEDILNV